MESTRKWDRFFAAASWLLVGGLIYAVVSLFITPPTGAGPVAQAFGIDIARWFYITLYLSEAGLLAYAKAMKKKNMRKKVLLAIYLTGIFTFVLAFMILGFKWVIVDNLIIGLVAGACWLYWKFKTEYIDPQMFYDEVAPLRDDLPPVP